MKLNAYATVALAGLLLGAAGTALAENITLVPVTVVDRKAVFATVESLNVIPARARINGTVAVLDIKEGDSVKAGQVLGTVGDEKIALQIHAMDSQNAALQAQLQQATKDLERAETLFKQGAVAKSKLEALRTAYNVAQNTVSGKQSEKSVLQRQITEGKVLAPVAGRVLKVPVTQGTVMMAGEPLAMIAEGNYVLRLRVPESHARFMKVGDAVTLDASAADGSAVRTGKIVTVYPEISEGRVVADATVEGLGDFFVGERVRVNISTGTRQVVLVPSSAVFTQAGIDYVRIKNGETVSVVPVQRGVIQGDNVEILSGLKVGDTVVTP